MSKARQAARPLTRWVYFTENMYRDSAEQTEFTYNGVVYEKSDKLLDIEAGNKRINGILLLILFATFIFSIKFENIWIIAGYLLVAVAGEIIRWQRLPRDITDELTDTGRRTR